MRSQFENKAASTTSAPPSRPVGGAPAKPSPVRQPVREPEPVPEPEPVQET